jgi:uncharacterized protein
MKRKIFGCFLLFVALTICFGGSVAAAEHPLTTVYYISAPFGTSTYVLGSALEDISKKYHPWLRISHSETPGLVYNIKKLDKEPALKKTTFIGVTLGSDWLAQKGLKPFDKSHPGAKLLGNFNLGATWLASLNPKIKTGKDLVGKKIGLGKMTQVIWGCEADWLIRLGWGFGDKVKIQYLGESEAPKALIDGLVDAAIIGGYIDPTAWQFIPGPPTLELLASGRSITHIPWGEDAVKRTIAGNIKVVPLTIPANTIQGQNEPLEAFSDPIAWVAYPEFPNDVAYEITKLMIKNVSVFKEYHALGKLMSPKGLVWGWDREAIHVGALKAYQEAGILK